MDAALRALFDLHGPLESLPRVFVFLSTFTDFFTPQLLLRTRDRFTLREEALFLVIIAFDHLLSEKKRWRNMGIFHSYHIKKETELPGPMTFRPKMRCI
ncbi:hypothetical protein SD70_17180 [Gordoniibacillus kamchatkensis]|uniref:Uncharacterized protein n=1 Tax=Gordoniibacillus kamchatkensis TaxID=1590651 RepID=A0ABR5AFW9_9BACL|nr:hypothetical protein SD70_17180 [Paenibacillus sp. VKM B-2647]